MKTILVRLLAVAVLVSASLVYLGRGPDYTIVWTRDVPSKESMTTLKSALDDTRNWPLFYHALKSVTFTENGQPVKEGTPLKPGMGALFAIEPKDKAWKRFDIRAEVRDVKPGEFVSFRLLEESTGKTTRVVDGLEWEVSIRTANEAEMKRGYQTVAVGAASALTKSARARFFGRFSPKILMNQLYQVDLVKLANFTANVEAKAKGTEPVYR